MSRTGLSAADVAKQFRDVCSDGSVEWVAGPMQTWLLLDAADMLDENAKLRELVRVFYHCTTSGVCDDCPVNGGGAVHLMPDTICDTMHDRMRELGVEVEQ